MIALINEIPVGHPYKYIAMCCTRVLDINGEDVKIYIMLSGAYDAYGLIGPEMNGIAILNDTHKAVVLDMEAQETSGWYPGFSGPSQRQIAQFEALAAMPDDDLVDWIRSHERYRHGSL